MNPTSNKLWSRDFTLVILGQIISLFGNAVLRFALPLYILERSGSAALFGQISALSFLPMILLAPIGGILADRIHKQRIMVALDFATAALMLAYLFISGITSAVAVVVVAMMALYAIQGLYSPAVQASIPLLVTTDELVPANGVVNLVTSLSGMIGPVIGGMLYGAFGLAPVVAVSGACFFFSAVMELFIRIPHRREKATGSLWRIAIGDMRASLRFIFREKPVIAKVSFLLIFFELFFSSMLIIGLPVLITQFLGMSGEFFGVTQGVLAAGGLVGGILAGVLGKRLSLRKTHLFLLIAGLSLLPMGLSLMIGLPPFVSYVVITAMCFAALLVMMLAKVQLFAFLQKITPTDIVGKVFSCMMALVLCAQPIGQALFGQLFSAFAANPWVVIAGSLALTVAVAVYSRRVLGGLEDGHDKTVAIDAIPN